MLLIITPFVFRSLVMGIVFFVTQLVMAEVGNWELKSCSLGWDFETRGRELNFKRWR